MKSGWFSVVLVLLVSVPGFAQSRPAHLRLGRSGGESGGGGNGRTSTPEEVAGYLDGTQPQHEFRSDVAYMLDMLTDGLKADSPLKIQDSRARPILEKVMALPEIQAPDNTHSGYHVNWAAVSIHKRMEGACMERNKKKDASISIASDKLDVCFSVPRLSRYPQHALEYQTWALFLHELVHAAGYGEDDANYVQDYFLNKILLGCGIHLSIAQPNAAQVEDISIEFEPNIGNYVSFDGEANRPGPSVGAPFKKYVTFSNAPYDINFSYTGKDVSLSFVALNADGSLAREQVSWHDNGQFATSTPTQYNLSLDGRALVPESVNISESCYW